MGFRRNRPSRETIEYIESFGLDPNEATGIVEDGTRPPYYPEVLKRFLAEREEIVMDEGPPSIEGERPPG